MHSKDVDEMEGSINSEQTRFLEQSDLGLHCLLSSICFNTYNFYGTSYPLS